VINILERTTDSRNADVADGFYCLDIQIRNNFKLPVIIRIEAFEASSYGGLVFEDVIPHSMDWNSLNLAGDKELHCSWITVC
jgi:hypothetical protein